MEERHALSVDADGVSQELLIKCSNSSGTRIRFE
jgi:hypothetical protein